MMRLRTVVALCGPPAAGKTTLADELMRRGAAVISNGKLITLRDQLETIALPTGLIVIDAPESIDDAALLAATFGKDLFFVVLDASTTTCFFRSRARQDQCDRLDKYLALLRTPHVQAEIRLMRRQRELPGTIIVETDDRSPDAIANEVLARLILE